MRATSILLLTVSVLAAYMIAAPIPQQVPAEEFVAVHDESPAAIQQQADALADVAALQETQGTQDDTANEQPLSPEENAPQIIQDALVADNSEPSSELQDGQGQELQQQQQGQEQKVKISEEPATRATLDVSIVIVK